MAEFTMELNDEQKEVRDWLHGFAADVVRPAAAEWDEREETPWPVIQEAAKVGIYSLDFYAQQYFDPTGLGIPFDVRHTDSVSLRRRHRISTGGESTWTPRSGPSSSGPPTADGASCWRPPTGWCCATAHRRP